MGRWLVVGSASAKPRGSAGPFLRPNPRAARSEVIRGGGVLSVDPPARVSLEGVHPPRPQGSVAEEYLLRSRPATGPGPSPQRLSGVTDSTTVLRRRLILRSVLDAEPGRCRRHHDPFGCLSAAGVGQTLGERGRVGT